MTTFQVPIERPAYYTHEHTSYITDVLYPDRRKLVVECLIQIIKYLSKQHDIGAIAACGGSGMAIAPIISYLTGIPLLIVHKEDDSSHADTQLRGLAASNQYIIIDDFIESGSTINWMIDTIDEWSDSPMECVGVLLYKGIYPTYWIKESDYWDNLKGLNYWGMGFIRDDEQSYYEPKKIQVKLDPLAE